MASAGTRFELFVARRYLRAKRKQAVIGIITVISVVGVAAGVMALVIALAINNGFRNTLQSTLLGAYAHVNIMEKEPGYGIDNWHELLPKLRALPHVVSASPTLYNEVYLYAAGSQAAVIKGIDTGSALESGDTLRTMKAGSLADLRTDGAPYNIILGDKLAAQLGAKIGQAVNVLSPQGGSLTPFGASPRKETFRVVGVFSSGFYEVDSSMAYISLPAAQWLLSLDDVVNNIELRLDDIRAAPEVARAAESVIGPKLGAATWMEQNRHILNALNMERTVTFITIGLIVLVAALNILITLIMMVMEKHKDIAILMSMGAKQAQIRRIFVYQGLLIGIVGTAIGLAAGHTLSFLADRYHWLRLDEEVYALSWVPFDPRWVDSVWIAAMALGISLLATIYPARNASRIAPAESLRYE